MPVEPRRPLGRALALPRWLRHIGLAATLVVAVAEFVSRLRSSSLFVDEVYSWRAADVPFGELLHRVRVDEVAPPTYYLLLKGWIVLFGSDSESVMRSLSVVAAVAMVAAVYWVANLLAGGLVATAAGLLAAVSPLVLEYGQQVRAYAWAMLAVTVAVGCVLQSEQDEARRGRWLTLGAVAAIGSLWLHYTTILVIAPLSVFVLATRWLSVAQRVRFVVAVGVGGALVLPILRAQSQGRQNAVDGIAQLTSDHVKRVFGAPFDRLYNVLSPRDTTVVAILVIISLLALALPRSRTSVRHPRLLAALAAVAPAALILVTLSGTNVVISRYDAVAVPFIVIALAATIAAFRPAGLVIVALALLIGWRASNAAHDPYHAYPDTRAAVTLVSQHWHSGDVLVVGNGYPSLGFNLEYYVKHLLPRAAPVGYGQGINLLFAVTKMKRIPGIAVITEPIGSIAQDTVNFAKAGFRVTGATQTGGTVPLQAFVVARRR